MIGCNNLKPGM